MLTNKGKYGLKALAYLAGLEEGAVAQSSAIAGAYKFSKKFLDAILNDLRKAGLVRTKKGPGGGYALARPADAIMVGDAIRALDGPLAPIACASRRFYEPCADCRSVSECEVRLVMARARDAMAAVLDHISLAELHLLSLGKSPVRKGRPAAKPGGRPAPAAGSRRRPPPP